MPALSKQSVPPSAVAALEYELQDGADGPRVPGVAWPLALAGAAITAAGVLTLVAADRGWVWMSSVDAYERATFYGLILCAYVGQPLAFATLLVVRRPWSRERPTCRLSHPVPLLALLTLTLPGALAVPLILLGTEPAAGLLGCAPVLLVLALLLWSGGVLWRRADPIASSPAPVVPHVRRFSRVGPLDTSPTNP